MNTNDDDRANVNVGSRKSPLALVQTNHVVSLLKEIYPKRNFNIVTITTTGDNIMDRALSKIGEKALFTKELEEALEQKKVDFVVHSLKDLPTSLPKNLVIGAICKRINPHDAVVLHPSQSQYTLDSLPPGSMIGTSSLRRTAQLRRRFQHLNFASIRGNINTRLLKLDNDGKYAGLILAAAGLIRMGWKERINQILRPEDCMHAVGQGALAVECREDDAETLSLIAKLNDKDTVLCCIAERLFMKTLDGGCSIPMAVSTYYKDGQLHLRGGVFSVDGTEALEESIVKSCEIIDDMDIPPSKRMRRNEISVTANDVGIIVTEEIPTTAASNAAQAGEALARSLLALGAQNILETARKANASPKEIED